MLKTFALHTLGCKVNRCDGEALATALEKAGYKRLNQNAELIDIYIINTCTVTHVVDKKSMQHIRRSRRLNPVAFIAVCGCMAQKDIAFEGVDFVFDARKPRDLLAALAARFHGDGVASISGGNAPLLKTRGFLKVQDGCDRYCAYCIVPYVRGSLASLPVDEVLTQGEGLIREGAKEIVLTGIQLSSYGKDKGGNTDGLASLIRNVGSLAGLQRLRLSSLDPWVVDDDFVQAITETPVVCGHFHLSLQSGCDATLARMNRRYTTDAYAQAANRLWEITPGAALTTDVIVGFPGETDADFETSMQFVQKMKFARVHVFPYSKREGTAAVAFPNQVSPTIIKARTHKMLSLASDLHRQFLQVQIGQNAEVLLETPTKGHTRNYCLVQLPNPEKVNEIYTIKITGFNEKGLLGAITND